MDVEYPCGHACGKTINRDCSKIIQIKTLSSEVWGIENEALMKNAP
jgi:hypothetical protein